MDIAQLTHNLKNVRHFRNLPISAICEIVLGGRTQTLQAGETIFREGEHSADLFVLIREQAHYKCGIHGQEAIIAMIQPVIMFNEVAALDGGDNPITAIPPKNSFIWRIDHARFQ